MRQGSAPEVLATLLADTGASAIHVTRGYEPWEMELEKAVARACEAAGAAFRVFGGRLLFEPEAIVTGDGKPYRVFTPFWKARHYLSRSACASLRPRATDSKS